MLLHNFFKFVLACTVLFFISKVDCQKCGKSGGTGENLVLSGERPTEGQWPWMVAITNRQQSGKYVFHCTGVLIDRIHVLTVAHCLDTDKKGRYSTRIGKVDADEGETYTIDRITFHPGYEKGKLYDDIAVLTLTREVDFPNFNPVCLTDAELSTEDLNDYGTTVVGWGSEKPRGSVYKYLQQQSGIPVKTNQYCHRTYRDNVPTFPRMFPGGIDAGMMCAGIPENEEFTCRFLSGAPLMYQENSRWFAVGLTSFGLGCDRRNIPNGYTRISNYLDWIREETSD